jgi:hypothetical protein
MDSGKTTKSRTRGMMPWGDVESPMGRDDRRPDQLELCSIKCDSTEGWLQSSPDIFLGLGIVGGSCDRDDLPGPMMVRRAVTKAVIAISTPMGNDRYYW